MSKVLSDKISWNTDPLIGKVNQPSAIPVKSKYKEFDWTHLNNKFSYLVGRVKTVVDASVVDKQQNKALKDLLSQEIWATLNQFLDDPRGDIVMPTVDERY